MKKQGKRVLVLGAGIVGRAAAWDLVRRGYQVTVADTDAAAAADVALTLGGSFLGLDVTNTGAVETVMRAHDAVVAAVPYHFGESLAHSAIAAGSHYIDFGGNPSVVKRQLQADALARQHDVAIVPDCGLAPGMANVIAASLIAESEADVLDSVQIRVGCIPQTPRGALQYQLAFYAGGLINEYVEPCEVISNGAVETVDPLTRFESLTWDTWGSLEAFATAGGTSTMCHDYAGIVRELEYKTIRYPGHGQIFRAMAEIGLLTSESRLIDGHRIAPRTVVEELLTEHLPQDEPDVVLVRISVAAAGRDYAVQLEDRHDGMFSALARTTAFPAAALCDLLLRGDVKLRGAAAMHNAVDAESLMAELSQVDLNLSPV